MKIKVGQETYLMHWETQKFNPAKGKNTGVKLVATDCIIRLIDRDGTPHEVSRGHVSQTAGDQANSVTARRLSFIKALPPLYISVRKALGHEYNRTCRVVSRTHNDITRKLKNRIKILEDVIIENGWTTAKVFAGLAVDLAKAKTEEAATA